MVPPVTPDHLRRAPGPVALLIGVLLLALAAPVTAVSADGPAVADSRQVKAMFVVSFLNFTEWPAGRLGPGGAPLVIAVLGDPTFAALVGEAAAGRIIAGRKVSVRAVAVPDEVGDAHLVFVSGSLAGRLPSVLWSLAGKSVLTVGDTDGFARDGVAINLYIFDSKVRIEVNTTAAARAGVHLSANLMRLARVVG
jgi:hypothetical protein